MTQLQEIFIENLKAARKRAGLTQDNLAEKVGKIGKYIGAIEQGAKFPSVQLIEDLAKALGIAPYELFLEAASRPGTSPAETIDAYNRYLEGILREAGKSFLHPEERLST